MRLFPAPRSLQGRLLLAALALVSVALVAAGLSIGLILQRFVRGQLDARLDDRIAALVAGGVGAEEGGEGEGRGFGRPRSGWYWQVRRGDAVERSASLAGRDLALPERAFRAREPGQTEPADLVGPWGEALIARVLVGADGTPSLVVATAPEAALRGPLAEAMRTLALSLLVIAILLVGGAVLQVRLGLRPLERLRGALADVRAGARAVVPADQPSEVRPLVEEINALLTQNARNLEGARAQVANLAHGLKTPLATLSLALAGRGLDREGDLAKLVEGMDRRVRHHLARARAAAVGGAARRRTPLGAHVEDLRVALLQLHAGRVRAIATAIPDGLAVACDPQDLDEMLGNLVENACRWCRGEVRIAAAPADGAVVIAIEDDGPGLDDAQIAQALRRGQRLDESGEGHGFGLPIAAELAGLYGGGLALDRSPLGGLRARLTLPA